MSRLHDKCLKEGDIERLKANVENLIEWQKTQNGKLCRIADQVTELNDALLIRFERIYEKFEGVEREQKKLLVAILSVLGASFLQFVLQFLLKGVLE